MTKKLEDFGGHLFSEDEHSHWVELKSKSNCKDGQLRVLGMFIKK